MTVKVWTLLFTTLLLVTGCSKSEVVTSYPEQVAKQDYSKQQPVQQEANNNPVPVVFDAFSSQAAATRAITTTSDLETSAGFGVFGYYTHQGSRTDGSDGVTTDGLYHYTGDASSYSAQAITPNFMYNQKVKYESSWGYTPLKYWPNDFVAGDVDDQSPDAAQGSMTSKLSFFAYAPWVAVASQTDATSIEGATTGNSTGIVGFSGNAYTGDPYIIYNQSNDAGDDDLLYAYTDNKNQTKPAIGTAISFAFKPALAKLDLTVSGLYDETPSESPKSKDISTNNHDISDYINFIKVESVSIKPYYLNALSEKVWITKKGRLNLNTGTWELSTGEQAVLGVNYSSSIVDNLKYNPSENKLTIANGVGRYYGVDGKTNNDPIPPSDATNINQELIKAGKNLFFIPFDDELHLKVSIKYHVYTLDARMKDGWSHIVNEVESVDAKDVVINTPKAGNTYTLQLVLGMTTVQMRVKDKDSADDKRDWWNLHPETSPSSGEHQIPYNP